MARVQLTERYAVEADKYCWHLIDQRESVDKKTGEPRITERVTYHASLEQVGHHILSRDASEAGDVKALLRTLERSAATVAKAIADNAEVLGVSLRASRGGQDTTAEKLEPEPRPVTKPKPAPEPAPELEAKPVPEATTVNEQEDHHAEQRPRRRRRAAPGA